MTCTVRIGFGRFDGRTDGLIDWTNGRQLSPTLTVFVTIERR